MRRWIRRHCGKFVRWALEGEVPTVSRDERTYTERTWRFTRLVAYVSLILGTLSILVSGGFILTIWTLNNEIVKRGEHILFDEKYDAIAAAASIGRLDIVAMILTFIGLVAAFSIIYGWTAFRSVAIEAAKNETKERVPRELRIFLDEDGDRLIGRALQDAELLAKIQQGFTAIGIDDTEDAEGVDTDANWTEEVNDEQRNRSTPEVPEEHSRKGGSPRKKSWVERFLGRRSQ